MAALNVQQKLFAYAYARCGNATEAAKEAGYSPQTARQQGARLLTNEAVVAICEGATERACAKVEISIGEVVQELVNILMVDPLDAHQDDGKVKPLKEWKPDLRRALSGYEVVESDDGTTVRKLKYWNKTAASDQLLRRLGAYKDPLADAVANIVDIINAATDAKADDDG